MGCFWGVDSLYGVQKGVLRTCCGYTGGKTTDPTYHDLENHTEVLKIDYDPTVIDYASESPRIRSCQYYRMHWSYRLEHGVTNAQ